jgi:CRISPR-associated endonuclease Csn1
MTKKILGLDLGVTSIGWALISETPDGTKEIIDIGSRIIPLSVDDKDEFSSGNAISKNQKRTLKRTQRKGYARYKLRRSGLQEVLRQHNMYPDDALMQLTSLALFGLRHKAVTQKIELAELGRILYHLNQKRGYKSSRSDANLDKKDTDYVAEVKSRHDQIKEAGLTVGQFFFQELIKDNLHRIKQQVFPREAYIQEFDAILEEQQKHYSGILTDSLVHKLRNEIIYYQRPLKSQKGLVNTCEFEGFYVTDKKGKRIFAGPKVAPKSSPLFQVDKIWETINSLALKNKQGETFEIPIEKKKEIFNYLDNNEILKEAKLFSILGLEKRKGWYGNNQTVKGLQGNVTKSKIREHLNGFDFSLEFDLTIKEFEDEASLIDKETGEVLAGKAKKTVSPELEKQPYYQLWHTIYAISDAEECCKALQAKFGFPEEVAKNLVKIDFTKSGFGNKSAKAMRKILPYLMEGDVYSTACSYAGYNHSNSLTKDERMRQDLRTRIEVLKKNSLRQPVVEKILNQMINLVNSLIEKYGSFTQEDEIRIELARELKQSKEERNDATIANTANEKINVEISARLTSLGIRDTKKNREKYKFIFPIRTVYNKNGSFNKKSFDDAQIVNQCIYCGETFSLTSALNGDDFDVDHIIPKKLLFDDSMTNRVLVHRKCNGGDKKDKTAFDFIRAKGQHELDIYLERLSDWQARGILSNSKLERLKISHEDYLERKREKRETEADKKIWEKFIERQLRETQYIARKGKEILEEVSYNVWSTNGSITAYLRHVWGWDDVLMNLQIPAYRELGLTKTKEWETQNGKKHEREEITNWSKRDDHRHHAIDALVVACTERKFIHRINTLNASTTRDEMLREIEGAAGQYNSKKNLMENYFFNLKPFSTKQVEEVASTILISFKPGKRVATVSKYKAIGKNLETGVIVPKGPLSEESVYGKIKGIEKKKPVKYLFENADLIYKPYIKALVEIRLAEHGNNIKLALASLKKEPIYLNDEKTIILEYGTCFKDEYVIKYPVESLKAKDIPYIVDHRVREIVQKRLNEFSNKEKEAFKDTLWFNEKKRIPIRTVRCYTGLSAVEPVKRDNLGKEIGFVKPGNNHHIAFYTDPNGKKVEHVCSFWHAVERKKYGIPVIIENPTEVWNKVLANQKMYSDSFLAKLPNDNYSFAQSLQQNEMFLLGLSQEVVEQMSFEKDKSLLTKYLYRVQKLATTNYMFRHHLETQINDSSESKTSKRFIHVRSIGGFDDLNPIKVTVSNIGEIGSPTID